MKVSLNWVKEFTDIKLTVDELVQKIGAQLGAVEEVIDLGKKYQGIVISKVVSCEKHPNADKLKVCLIDDGKKVKSAVRNKDGFVEVVCGAPNVKEGLLVAWLPPGTVVPSTFDFDKDPFRLEARELRGVVSNGMLASANELALSDDHGGIMELSFGKVGADFAEEFGLNDYIIDIENKMFTHRPDLFGILGVAREIAGITGVKFQSPDWYLTTGNRQQATGTSKLSLEVKNEVPESVPRFIAQVIEGVEVKASPVWMQAYLSRVGIRPINNIVDVTNYVMYLTAQPLHAYDYDKLAKSKKQKAKRIIVRHPKKDEKITLLGGKKIEPHKDDIMIADEHGLIGIGGVMGGADTEVDENTKNIVLECANFDMYAIRRSSMRHGLFTDAVTRFNKGQSPLQIPPILSKAKDWSMQLAGGNAGKAIDDHQKLSQPIAVHVTGEFINSRLGLKLGIKDMAKLLTNVEFDASINGPTLAVTPPFWRTDIEIAEDVVEEIGRLYGYDHLPLELPKRSLTPPPKNPMIELKDKIRQALSSAGANELLTYSFVHGNLLAKVGQDKEKAFQLSNALSPDLQYYRLSLTPSLLEKVHPNIKAGHGEFAIFEIGKSHQKDSRVTSKESREDGLPKEFERASFVFASDKKSAVRHAGAAYYQARQYCVMLLDKLGLAGRVVFEQIITGETDQSAVVFSPARSATIKIDGRVVGQIGEYTREIQQALKLPEFTAGFELDITALAFPATDKTSYTTLSRFPKVQQDISLKVPAKLAYGELYECMKNSVDKLKPRQTIARLEPIDIYQRLEDKKHKQITFRLEIASYERTLTDQEVNNLLDAVAEAAHKKFSAQRI